MTTGIPFLIREVLHRSARLCAPPSTREIRNGFPTALEMGKDIG